MKTFTKKVTQTYTLLNIGLLIQDLESIGRFYVLLYELVLRLTDDNERTNTPNYTKTSFAFQNQSFVLVNKQWIRSYIRISIFSLTSGNFEGCF